MPNTLDCYKRRTRSVGNYDPAQFLEVRQAIEEYRRRRAAAIAEKAKLAEAREQLSAALDAQTLIQKVASRIQTEAHSRIASVVCRCLQTVFPEKGYGFAIHFDRKAGRTQARMVFTKDGEEANPLEEDSGGVVDVAAFGLRLACLLLSSPRQRKFLCLDEPFRCVAGKNLAAAAQLVEVMSKELGVQFLIVTHEENLQVGRVVQIA